MNADAKFVASVMDARLKKVKRECDSFRKQRDELINDMAEVKLSQESYDELLSDIKALRLQADTYFEQWQDAKRKAEAWDKLKEDYIIDINSAIDTTLYYSHPNAPAQEDMGAINILLTQLLSDLERGSDE